VDLSIGLAGRFGGLPRLTGRAMRPLFVVEHPTGVYQPVSGRFHLAFGCFHGAIETLDFFWGHWHEKIVRPKVSHVNN